MLRKMLCGMAVTGILVAGCGEQAAPTKKADAPKADAKMEPKTDAKMEPKAAEKK